MREYSFDRPLDKFHRTARTWFDGSVESVDCRLADCRRLLASSMAAVGSNWGSQAAHTHLDRIASLQAQERVLVGQRESLLTAGHDREARGAHEKLDVDFAENAGDVVNPYTGETGRRMQLEHHGDDTGFHWKPRTAGDSAKDARYIELEAAKFVASNPGVDRDELITRAAHKAQVETSTFSKNRSESITRAFCARVAQLHRPVPRQRTAATTTPDCADEMLFVV